MEAVPAASSSEDGTLFADHRIVEASVDVHPAPPANGAAVDPAHITRPSFKLHGLETTSTGQQRHQLPLQESSSMDTATIGSSKSLVTDQGEFGRQTLLAACLCLRNWRILVSTSAFLFVKT